MNLSSAESKAVFKCKCGNNITIQVGEDSQVYVYGGTLRDDGEVEDSRRRTLHLYSAKCKECGNTWASTVNEERSP